MAIPKFNVPNLCGASPELNAALSKIDDLKKEITANIDIDPSAMASALTSKLNDVKSSLDGLAPDLPEIPAINFQSELTSLISDIDKTSVEGLAAFNNKLADIEKNFGDALTKAGKSLDSLVADATAAIAGGGDVCKVAPNFELPQTAEAEVVEKAAGVKTALKNAVDEAPSIVKNNVKVETIKESLKTKQQDIDTGEIFTKPDETGFVKKADIVKDVEPVVTKTGGTITATTPTKSNIVTTETITTTSGGGYTITRSAPVTKRKVQSDKGLTTRVKNKFEYFVLKGSINETFWSDGGRSFSGNTVKKHKVIDDFSKVTLKFPFNDIKSIKVSVEQRAIDLTATKVLAYYGRYSSMGYKRLDYVSKRKGSKQKLNEIDYELPTETDQKLLELIDYETGQPLSEGTRMKIRYTYLEKYDPNFSG